MRDDFSAKTIRTLAARVGYHCSNAGCVQSTSGPALDEERTVNIGVGAHITAAAEGFKRYDKNMSPAERRSGANGIWLCQSCSKLIDSDESRYTVALLHQWKKDAIQRTLDAIAGGRPLGPVKPSAALDTADEDFLRGLNLPSADAVDVVGARLRAATQADIQAFRAARGRPARTIALTLSLEGSAVAHVTLESVARLTTLAEPVAVVAPGGTGKSTTLVQLAECMGAQDGPIPVLVPLGEWSDRQEDFFDSILRRNAFGTFRRQHLMQLAYHGLLILLLDGWNELTPEARLRATNDLTALQRDYPQLGVAISSRRQALPVVGTVVAIEALSQAQQMELAQAARGQEGIELIDRAWRTPGVRELVGIPLYLNALLTMPPGAAFPETKEAVLRMFVEHNETAPDKLERLQRDTLGQHTVILTGLAVEANRSANTVISDSSANRTVSRIVRRLSDDGQIQIGGTPQPRAIIDGLVGAHLLVRSAEADGAVSFQHHLFQEWYAATEVEDLMVKAAAGDPDARKRLREDVLDKQSWEESILFACDRLSRAGADGVHAVATAVDEALGIDPLLASEMIYRSSPAVWEIVKVHIIAFVDRWHRPGTVDRAVRFMIMTGRPEFESQIWPLASSPNSQVQLPTLRTAPRFRPTVLGPDLHSKIAALPEDTREHLLALIASESGLDGMDLATDLAKTDPSPKVQAEVVQYLQFRGADRHVAVLLAEAHDQTWALLAKRGYAEEIRDPAIAARLRSEREKVFAQATDPVERLRWILDQSPDYPDRDAAIAAAIADARFPVRDQHAGSSLYFAQQRAPAAVLQGLRQRLESGLELPFHAVDLLDQLGTTDEGPIAAAILDVSQDNKRRDAVAVMAGSKTVGVLLDKFMACAKALSTARNDQALSDEYHRLRSRISATRAPSFVAAVMARANTDDPALIESLASLITLHGDSHDRKSPMPFDPVVKSQLIDILRNWVEVVISSPSGGRYQLNEVSNAIGRIGFRELVPELKRLLDEDLARLKKALDGYLEARRRGDIDATSDASMRYGNQYQAAFVRLGGDEAAAVAAEYLEDRVFGFDASLILKAISDKELNLSAPGFNRRWPWFDEVAAARAVRAISPKPEPANAFAAPIFAAIDRLAKPETDKEGQVLAIRLARIALAMPHSDQDALMARVMALPQPMESKRELLAAIALDGQVLDASVVMRGVDEWLEEAPNNAWHKKQNTWEIEPWLELLPFTTGPEAVIDGLTKVKAFYGREWAKRWPRVLTAVAGVPGPEGEALLAALARTHKDIADDFEWMKAILGRDSLAAVLLYVELFMEGVFGRGPHAADGWHVGRELAPYVQKFPQLKAELKKRYAAVGTGPARAMLEHIFGEIGGDDNLIAMVTKYAASGQTYDGRMDGAVRAVALRHEPVQDSSNSYYIYPASVARVRKFLFGLLRGTPQEAALGKSCLIAIDVLRDEHGIAANDARHPDVQSEIPWPPEAGQS